MASLPDTVKVQALVVPESLQEALDQVADPLVPLEQRGQVYGLLRRLRLKIDRALRDPGKEITEAMVRNGISKFAGLRLKWTSIDARYVINDPSNWDDGTAQEFLELARKVSPDLIRVVPAHLEVDTVALRDALTIGDPVARELYEQLTAHRYRTEEGRNATLTVDEK